MFRASVLRLGVVALPIAVWAAPPRAAAQPGVTLSEDANSATLANGIVSARIEKKSGDILSLKYRGLELIGRGRGYWSFDAESEGREKPVHFGGRSEFRVRIDPASNRGGRPSSTPMCSIS